MDKERNKEEVKAIFDKLKSSDEIDGFLSKLPNVRCQVITLDMMISKAIDDVRCSDSITDKSDTLSSLIGLELAFDACNRGLRKLRSHITQCKNKPTTLYDINKVEG